MRQKKILKILAVCFSTVMLTQPASAAAPQQTAQGSLGSVTEESQILPIPDGSGKYILKSSGFYCLNEDGTRENAPAVHYFDHFVIDGTVFDGYYYHDENRKKITLIVEDGQHTGEKIPDYIMKKFRDELISNPYELDKDLKEKVKFYEEKKE